MKAQLRMRNSVRSRLRGYVPGSGVWSGLGLRFGSGIRLGLGLGLGLGVVVEVGVEVRVRIWVRSGIQLRERASRKASISRSCSLRQARSAAALLRSTALTKSSSSSSSGRFLPALVRSAQTDDTSMTLTQGSTYSQVGLLYACSSICITLSRQSVSYYCKSCGAMRMQRNMRLQWPCLPCH